MLQPHVQISTENYYFRMKKWKQKYCNVALWNEFYDVLFSASFNDFGGCSAMMLLPWCSAVGILSGRFKMLKIKFLFDFLILTHWFFLLQ